MLNRIIYFILMMSFILVTSSRVDAQNKSFERKRHKKIAKKENMDIDKCMDIIASNEEMSNLMLKKIGAEYNSKTTVLDNSNDIKALMPQMNNEIKPDIITKKKKSLNFNKSNYKKK